ncbi:formylmethanofuran dehydrogenase [Methyloceanibacter sp.]|uniref:formylmethanofuran dehydrogenase n=1 Tax=Methyloceanibacter sp. TaxID=1965321 RepID=UPI00351AD719
MPKPSPRQPKGERASTELFENVVDPFCGMLCDDLVVERIGMGLKVVKNGSRPSIAGFERKLPPASPSMNGRDVAFAASVKEAARLIGKAKLPLFGGLATDVEGMRATLALAERAGGIVDHALSEAGERNLKILQTSGWITTTLTETRNRADLIIIAGSDIHRLHPRFFERIVSPPGSMFDVTAQKRTVVFIGKGLDRSGAQGSQIGEVVTLGCKDEEAGHVVALLRARLRGFRVTPPKHSGVTLAEIDALAERCRQAAYGVVVWAPPSLDFPHAELAVEQFTGLVKDLNPTTRFAGLSLGGAEGAPTAASVCTWISGYPLRVSYASGAPDYDPYRFNIARMLEDGEGDLLVWVAAISPDLVPPPTKIPTIVLGTPGIALTAAPSVFIPIGTPGLDHAGRLIRVDNVMSLPLKDLGRAQIPSAAEMLSAIEAAL